MKFILLVVSLLMSVSAYSANLGDFIVTDVNSSTYYGLQGTRTSVLIPLNSQVEGLLIQATSNATNVKVRLQGTSVYNSKEDAITYYVYSGTTIVRQK